MFDNSYSSLNKTSTICNNHCRLYLVTELNLKTRSRLMLALSYNIFCYYECNLHRNIKRHMSRFSNIIKMSIDLRISNVMYLIYPLHNYLSNIIQRLQHSLKDKYSDCILCSYYYMAHYMIHMRNHNLNN